MLPSHATNKPVLMLYKYPHNRKFIPVHASEWLQYIILVQARWEILHEVPISAH